MLALGTVGTALAMVLFALLRLPLAGMLAALLAGMAWLTSLSTLNVAAQLATPDALRARGMALYTAVFYGCLALGSLLWGQVATHFGLRSALLAAAAGAADSEGRDVGAGGHHRAPHGSDLRPRAG